MNHLASLLAAAGCWMFCEIIRFNHPTLCHTIMIYNYDYGHTFTAPRNTRPLTLGLNFATACLLYVDEPCENSPDLSQSEEERE